MDWPDCLMTCASQPCTCAQLCTAEHETVSGKAGCLTRIRAEQHWLIGGVDSDFSQLLAQSASDLRTLQMLACSDSPNPRNARPSTQSVQRQLQTGKSEQRQGEHQILDSQLILLPAQPYGTQHSFVDLFSI